MMLGYFGGKNFVNYRDYPKRAIRETDKGSLKLKSRQEKIAIVVQGPVITEENFTIESLRLYRYNMPDALLILSTWYIPEELNSEIESCNIQVIINKRPDNPGVQNVNMQIIATRAGVIAAEKMGAEYILKTRTDQRIYHPSIDVYLLNLLSCFPLSHEYPAQAKRLVAISLNTFRYRMYGISDMFLFGWVSDMVMYWNIPEDDRLVPSSRDTKGRLTWKEASRRRFCEVYFCTEYLKKIGKECIFTLEDSFRVMKEHFIIIDREALRLYWHKYTINSDRYAGYGLYDPEISFNDWLLLYNAFDKLSIDEKIIDEYGT